MTRAEKIEKALVAAAGSLEWIAEQRAVSRDVYEVLSEVRQYARSRADMARAALALPPDAPEAPPARACTGLTARWCPAHGVCLCPTEDLAEPACPLHSVTSQHRAPADAPEAGTPADVCSHTGRRHSIDPTINRCRFCGRPAASATPSPAEGRANKEIK